jgi:hypothetical protein
VAMGFEVLGTTTSMKHFVTGKDIRLYSNIPRKTQINKSVVQDMMIEDFGPNKFSPAVLSPVRVGDKMCYPLLNALGKLAAYSDMVEQAKIDKINEHIYATVMSWPTRFNEGDARLLTEDECINGYGVLKQIDMSTSPGFPYVQMGIKKSGLFDRVGKFDPPQYRMNDLLRKQVNIMEDLARKGIGKQIFECDALKDETRELGKILKPRIFEVGPIEHQILMRKYFGWLIGHFFESFLTGEYGPGINCNSREWDLQIKILLAVSDLFMNGDYEWWDARLAFQLIMQFATLANKFYDDGEINKLIRRVLVAMSSFAKHLIETIVFLIRQGNPSGVWITTFLNCFLNQIFIRLAYLDLVDSSLHDFNNFVKSKFFGDDNLIAVSRAIIHLLNMQTYAKCLKKYGVYYKTADKKDVEKLYYTIEECSYLKRYFYFDQRMNIWISRLDKNVIMEIARWAQGDQNNMRDQMNRFNAALYEMSNWGKEEFISLRKIFVKYCIVLVRNGFAIDASDLFTYDFCRYNMYPEFNVEPKKKFLVDNENYLTLYDVGMIANSEENWDYMFMIPPILGMLYVFWKWIKILILQDREMVRLILRRIIGGNENVRELAEVMAEEADPRVLITRQNRWGRRALASDFIANADTNITLDKPEGITTVEKIVKFIEADIPEHDPTSLVINRYPDYMPKIDLPMFLSRPFVIGEFDFTAAMAFKTKVFEIDVPFILRQNVYLNYKTAGVAFWRPNTEVTIRINGTAMHYGRLVFWWLPQNFELPALTYDNFENAFNNRWIQVSANAQRTATLDIPYVYHQPWLQVNSISRTSSIYGHVSINLNSIQGPPPPVHVAVYLRVINPTVVGYTSEMALVDYKGPFDNDLSQIIIEENDFIANASENVTVSTEGGAATATNTININSGSGGGVPRPQRPNRGGGNGDTSFSSWVEKIPIIGGLAKPFTDILGLFGFSIPNSEAVTSPFGIRQPLYNRIEDTPLSLNMGFTQKAEISRDFSMVNGIPQEMNLLFYGQRFGLIHTGQIDANMNSGDVIYDLVLNPINFVTTDYINRTMNPEKFYPTPASYACRPFLYHHGSLDFEFDIEASSFHSVWLRFCYIPYGLSTPTLAESSNCVNITLDVTKSTEIRFSIPYLQQTMWRQNPHAYEAIASHQWSHNGRLLIMIVNKLTAGVSPAPPIGWQLFGRLGADYQFAVPEYDTARCGVFFASEYPEFNYRLPNMAPNLNLMKLSKKIKKENNEKAKDMISHSEEMPSMSWSKMMHADYPTIGGISTGYVDHKVHMSGEITTIKEMCNMVQPIQLSNNVPAGTVYNVWLSQNYQLYEWKNWQGTATSGRFNEYNFLHFLNYWKATFRYYRGGIRFVFWSRAPRTNGTAFWSSTSIYDNPNFNILVQESTIDVWSEEIHDVYATQFWSNLELSPMDITLPYFNPYQCVPIWTKDGEGTNPNGVTQNLFVSLLNYEHDNQYRIGMGGADDFILGFQISPPAMHIPNTVVHGKKGVAQTCSNAPPFVIQMSANEYMNSCVKPTTTTTRKTTTENEGSGFDPRELEDNNVEDPAEQKLVKEAIHMDIDATTPKPATFLAKIKTAWNSSSNGSSTVAPVQEVKPKLSAQEIMIQSQRFRDAQKYPHLEQNIGQHAAIGVPREVRSLGKQDLIDGLKGNSMAGNIPEKQGPDV